MAYSRSFPGARAVSITPTSASVTEAATGDAASAGLSASRRLRANVSKSSRTSRQRPHWDRPRAVPRCAVRASLRLGRVIDSSRSFLVEKLFAGLHPRRDLGDGCLCAAFADDLDHGGDYALAIAACVLPPQCIDSLLGNLPGRQPFGDVLVRGAPAQFVAVDLDHLGSRTVEIRPSQPNDQL